MANVKPFCAVRPAVALASRVAALPYDVYSRQEACLEVKDKPLSFLNIDRAETQFDDSVDTYDDRVYAKANELLRKAVSDGTYIKDNNPCYYIYALTMGKRTQKGIVGCSSIDDYENHIIKKHENTRADKELDRIRHVDSCSAQTGPIFLAYRSDKQLDTLVEKASRKAPEYDFASSDGIRHQVWVVSDLASVDAFKAALDKLPSTYIADGHHRAASAVKVGLMRRKAHPDYTGDEEFNFFLSVLFPDDQLFIMPYNRVIKDLNGLSSDEFLKNVSERFEVSECSAAYTPEEKAVFGMYLDDKWYCLKARPELLSTDPVDGLDVSILQNNLLKPILCIDDPRTDKRIDFIGGIRGISELERRVHTDMRLAFSLYPTSIAELLSVADAGRLMPPKSTWFEPKLRSGLFIHLIER